ncbi:MULTISPECIES: DUF6022 family protein [Paenibacillus]|uniref:DUF6022 family protein n=1 Tax=Paenibacillus TaxID=44249 RepID=UPI0022B88DAD|nr:DUF6022 family protein [Paenibacillus caseinilyticus]MCZ8519790.1 DUF6022 family protein [Paenibacillus caseinilyticus]
MTAAELFTPGMTAQDIAVIIQQEFTAKWKQVLEEHREELERVFPELEDSTYGLYMDYLLPPVFGALERAGYQVLGEVKETDFIIAGCLNFRCSLEQWGPEHHRSRVFWITIREEAQQEPAGTLLLDFYHSHAGFDVPAAPEITAIPAVDRREIIAAVRRMKEAG